MIFKTELEFKIKKALEFNKYIFRNIYPKMLHFYAEIYIIYILSSRLSLIVIIWLFYLPLFHPHYY